jgi:hypothetical protein
VITVACGVRRWTPKHTEVDFPVGLVTARNDFDAAFRWSCKEETKVFSALPFVFISSPTTRKNEFQVLCAHLKVDNLELKRPVPVPPRPTV